MPRFTIPVTARIREIREFLGIIRQGAPPVLEAFVSEFGSLVDAKGCAYGVQVEEQGYSMSFCHVAGFDMPKEIVIETLNGAVLAQHQQLGFYTPARIDRWQRNVAVAFPQNSQVIQGAASLPEPLSHLMETFQISARRAYETALTRLRLVNDYQLRVLVCEGTSLLSWVGAFRSEPFEARDRRTLQALVPALRERLRLEAHWEQAVFNAHAVPMLLENIPSAALIVAASGRIGQANAVARGWLARDPDGLREAIAMALRGKRVLSAQLSRISAPGWPPYYLAIFTHPGDPSMRIELAKRRWNLTQREAELLVRLALGASNKALAASLDCAVRTIEQHVTHLLEKMQVGSRAAASAQFWLELGDSR